MVVFLRFLCISLKAHGIWNYGPLPSKFRCLPNVKGLQNRVSLTPPASTYRVEGVPGRAFGRQVATQSRQRGPQSRHMALQSRQRAPRCHPQGAQHRKFTKKALRSMLPSSAEPRKMKVLHRFSYVSLKAHGRWHLVLGSLLSTLA